VHVKSLICDVECDSCCSVLVEIDFLSVVWKTQIVYVKEESFR
jgi:hypothetical protein